MEQVKTKMPKKSSNTDAVFNRRFEFLKDKLRNQFFQLYTSQGNVEEHFSKLIKVLEKGYKARPVNLRKSDIEREKDPKWFLSEKWVGMMLYTDHFSGKLSDLENHLDYLDDLGVNLLHLMPLLKSPNENNDGGYAVSDYRNLDDRIGTIQEFSALTNKLHKQNKLVMIDFVLNHTSDEHEWAIKAKAGDPQYQNYYYFHQDKTVINLFEKNLPEVFPDTSPGNFTYVDELDKWVMTVFNSYQWDLNYTNPQVFIEMVDIMVYLANRGVDILRMDALAFMWKKMGTDSQNLDEAHLLIKAMKSCIQMVAPGTLFLAEAIVAPNEIIKYFGEGSPTTDECEMAYNATFMVTLWDAIATKNNKLLLTTLHNIPLKPFGSTWLNYIRCHDDIGLGYDDLHASWSGYDPVSHRKFLTDFLIGRHQWSFSVGEPFMENEKTGDARISGTLASLAGLEKAVNEKNPETISMAIDRIIFLHSLILSFGGIPMLYSGDELAQLNDHGYTDVTSKSDDSRWLHRPKMDWKKAEERADGSTIHGRVFQALKRMIEERKNSPELAAMNNRQFVDLHNEHVLGFVRSMPDKLTLIIANLNDHTEFIDAHWLSPFGFDISRPFIDKLTGKEFRVIDGRLKFDPYASPWLKQE